MSILLCKRQFCHISFFKISQTNQLRATMQTANPPNSHAIPPSGTQMQEMFELSSWLGDVFTPAEAPVHHPAPMTDIDIKPEMLLSPMEGLDHEVDIIASSPTISLDCFDAVHPVSPITS